MNKVFTYIGYAATAMVVANLATKYFSNSVEISKIGVKKEAITATGMKLRISFTLTNHSFVNARLNSIIGLIKYGPASLARIDMNQAVDLFPNKPLELSTTVTIDWSRLVTDLYSLFASGSFLKELSFDGVISTGIGKIGVKMPIRIAD